MADLSIKIKADFEGAIKQFDELAQSSEATKAQIEDFAKHLKVKEFDEFTAKQNLIGVALKATGDDMKALTVQSDNYKREIERLIKGGMKPNDEMIQKLQVEYSRLQTEIQNTTKKQKLAEDGMKTLEKAAMAGAAALAAVVTAAGASIQKTAEAGDAYAKTARVIGTTAETLQEFEFAAKRSGVESGALYTAMEKLNKEMGDVKNGTGTLTKYLKDNNEELLNSLQNAKDNEEAFMLVMDALHNTTDEFGRAKLATELFGRSGQDLIKMTENGAQGISDLREEARKYGIISNEAAAESEKFMDAEENLKRAMTGLSNEIGSALMPKFTDIIQGAADFVSGIDDLEGKLRTATTVIASTTVALGTFLVATKAAKAIGAVSGAVKGLTEALNKNPIAAIASVIAAFAVPMFIDLADRMGEAKKRAEELTGSLEENNKKYIEAKTLIGDMDEKKTIDIQTTIDLIRLYPELSGVIRENVTTYGELEGVLNRVNTARREANIAETTEAYQKQLKLVEKLSGRYERLSLDAQNPESIPAPLERMSKELDNEKAKLEDLRLQLEKLNEVTVTPNLDSAAAAKAAADAAAAAAKAEAEARAKAAAEAEAAAKAAADAAKAEAEARAKAAADELLAKNTARNEDIIAAKKHAEELAKIQSDYNEVWKAEQEAKAAVAAQATAAEQLNMDIATAMLEETLAKRKEIEDKARADKWLAENTARNEEIIAAKEQADELVRINEEHVNQIKKQDEEMAKAKKAVYNQTLDAVAQLAGGMSQLIEVAGQENRGALIAAKALAITEATINSYQAFGNALATVAPPPVPQILAAAALATGLANVTKIATTPIPAAETGGRFEVPSTFTGVDSALMRVNAGETVTVEPRGGDSEQMLHITVVIGEQSIVDVVNRKIDSGEIRIVAERNV